MKQQRASSFALGVGVMLMVGLGLLIVPATVMAVDTTSPIVGAWEGTLDPGAQPAKRVVVHITVGQDGTLSGTIDYPDQDTSGILITAITYKQPVLHLESSSALVSFDGNMNKGNSEISGTWTQGQGKLNLVLKRTP
jgi:hypothetical protein